MANIIVIAIIVCVIGSIIFYLYKAKRRGETCIGCPYAKQCGAGKCNGSCSTQHSGSDKMQ